MEKPKYVSFPMMWPSFIGSLVLYTSLYGCNNGSNGCSKSSIVLAVLFFIAIPIAMVISFLAFVCICWPTLSYLESTGRLHAKYIALFTAIESLAFSIGSGAFLHFKATDDLLELLYMLMPFPWLATMALCAYYMATPEDQPEPEQQS